MAELNALAGVSTRRGIGDFTEDGAAAGARGRRKIRRALMERFVREKSERKGFLGVFGDAETR